MEDKILQQASDIIKTLNWKEFNISGYTDPYFDYYYAESELYLIRNKSRGSIYFVKAKSPYEAWNLIIDVVVRE